MNEDLSPDNAGFTEVNTCPKCGLQRRRVKNGKTSEGETIYAYRCSPCQYKLGEPRRLRLADKIIADRKARYNKDPEKARQQRRNAYAKDPEKEKEAYRNYKLLHPEKVNASKRKWEKTTENGKASVRHAQRKRKMRLRATSPEVRVTQKELQLLKEREHHCRYCGIHGSDTAIGKLVDDHVHPIAKKGEDALHNLTRACDPCNKKKAGKLPEVWAKEIGIPFPFPPPKIAS